MGNGQTNEELQVKDVEVDDGHGEDNVTDQHHPTYDIRWYGANIDIEGLVRRFNKDRVFWPEFQRQFVWNRKQASRLIESVLIGLPIPSIFLYKDEKSERNFIIDGLQRMMTLSGYMKGPWPDADPESRLEEGGKKGRVFRLTGLPDDSKFMGKSYEQLDDNDRERFDNTLIHVLFIEQKTPDNNQDSAFHMFERLNSGGTPLQPQEMLNALYGGSLRKHLYDLTKCELWEQMFGNPHKRAKDQELILRFLALLHREEEYKAPMKLFLRDFMRDNREADENTLSEFSEIFTSTLRRIHEAQGNDAFRPYGTRTFSAPYFDAFMVVVAKDQTVTTEMIRNAFKQLKGNEDFEYFTRAATTDASAIKERFRMVREAINAQP